MEKIKTKTVISDTIDNWLISTKGHDKNAQIYQLTQFMQPYLAMIFVNTKTRADELHSYLTAQGLKVAKIHGDITPRERKRIMNQVQNLDFEYIVATDLAARGIDIEGVSHVINDAIPQDLSFLFIVLVVLDEMAYQVQLLPFISQVMTRISVSWRNWESSLVLRWSKTGNFKIPMTVIVVPTVRKNKINLISK